MDWEALELLVRDASFLCVLVLGMFVLLGCVAFTGVWSLKAVLRLVGLYVDFMRFSQARRRR